jgi:hypothetical protein
MNATITSPATPGPSLDSVLLAGDFYSYEQLLSDPEQETVAPLRDFSRTERSRRSSMTAAR